MDSAITGKMDVLIKDATVNDGIFSALTYTIPADLAADASYKVVVTVLAKNETSNDYTVQVMEVPYYFLAVKPD